METECLFRILPAAGSSFFRRVHLLTESWMGWVERTVCYLGSLSFYGSHMGQVNAGVEPMRFFPSHDELFCLAYRTCDLNPLPLRSLTYPPLIFCVWPHSPGVKDPTPFLARFDNLACRFRRSNSVTHWGSLATCMFCSPFWGHLAEPSVVDILGVTHNIPTLFVLHTMRNMICSHVTIRSALLWLNMQENGKG